MSKPTGPACGNNPNYRMSDGDRQAVADFKAYLADRAELRDRIAEALYAHDHPGHLVPLNETGMEPAYRESADAVLAVLPPPTDRAAVERIRAVLETDAVVGRSALEYRGLIASALMADEAQQQEPGRSDVGTEFVRQADQPDEAGLAAFKANLADGSVRCRLCPYPVTLHTPNGARAHFTTVHPEQRITGRGSGPWLLLVTDGDEAQQQPDTETQAPAEDPARIDRLRPEFTEHSSIEAIDAQLRRSRSQQRRWHLRTEWLISLRQRRVKQKTRGEWPDSGPGRVADEEPAETQEGPRTICVCGHTKGEHITVSGRLLCDACDPDSTENLVCKEFEAL